MKRFFIRFIIISIVVSTLVLLTLDQLGYSIIGIDDANIFFVYAKHIAEGYGFVYNIGGERVEGVTSLLWTLIAAIAFSITNYPEALLLLINVIILSAAMTFTTAYLDHLFEWKEQKNFLNILSPYSAIYLFLVFSSADYITWMTVTLMDSGIWGCLLMLTSIMVLMSTYYQASITFNFIFSALIGLLLLTRPEAILWCLVFIGCVWFQNDCKCSLKKANAVIFWPLVCYLLVLSFLTIFRLSYFGYPLPNTYYAKIAPSFLYNLSQGLYYFRGFISSSFLVQFSMLCFFLFFYCNCSMIIRSLAFDSPKAVSRLEGSNFLVFIVLTGLFIPVITGGDHFSCFRFYQPVYPMLILNIFIFWKYINSKWIPVEKFKVPFQMNWKIIWIIVLVFTFESQYIQWKNLRQFRYIKREFYVAEKWRNMGKFLSEFWENNDDKYPSIGSILAGGIKMSYPGEVIDLMGLNNTRMAHNLGTKQGIKNHAAFEKTVFYKLRPDIVFPYLVPNEGCIDDLPLFYHNIITTNWVQASLKNIWNDTEFKKKYDFVQLTKKTRSSDQCLIGFMSKHFLSTIRSNNAPLYKIQILPNY